MADQSERKALSETERALARQSLDNLYRDAELAPLRSQERAALLASAARMAALVRGVPVLRRKNEHG